MVRARAVYDSRFLGFLRAVIEQNFLGQINGPALALLKGTAYIFSNDSGTEQLDRAKEKNQDDDGGIPGDIDPTENLLQQHRNQIQYRTDAGDTAQDGGQTERGGGKTDDSFNGVLRQLPEIPFRGSGGETVNFRCC